jgi:hypothetical protein
VIPPHLEGDVLTCIFIALPSGYLD